MLLELVGDLLGQSFDPHALEIDDPAPATDRFREPGVTKR